MAVCNLTLVDVIEKKINAIDTVTQPLAPGHHEAMTTIIALWEYHDPSLIISANSNFRCAFGSHPISFPSPPALRIAKPACQLTLPRLTWQNLLGTNWL